MNSFSHYMIGSFLMKYIRKKYGIKLSPIRFLYWNVMTDFRRPYSRQSHQADGLESHVQTETETLAGTKQPTACFGPEYSKSLGVVCHFYADFFCFPHAPVYQGTYWQHIKYEWELYRYMRKSFSSLCRTELEGNADNYGDPESITALYEALRRAYLSSTPSFKIDIIFALRACLGAIMMITRASIVKPAAKPPVLSGL